MKLYRPALAATLLACLYAVALMPSGGCGVGQIFGPATTQPALTNLGRVDEARKDYIAALNTLAPLIEGGVIKDVATLEALKEIRKRTPAELDEAEKWARAGNAFNFDYALKRVLATVATLKAEKVRRVG